MRSIEQLSIELKIDEMEYHFTQEISPDTAKPMDCESKWAVLSWLEIEKKLTITYRSLQVLGNIIGIVACFSYFVFFYEYQTQFSEWTDTLPVAVIMSLFLILLGRWLSNVWMKDIIVFVQHKIDHLSIPEIVEQKAKQKILNLPIISAAISMFNWSMAAAIMPFFFTMRLSDMKLLSIELNSFFWVFLGILISGLVTSVMVFFNTELMCRPVWERFFPEGKLIQTKGVFRINLWARILIIFLMVSLFPLTDMAVVSYQKAQMMVTKDPVQVLQSLRALIIFLLVVEFSLVIALSMFMSRSIVAPILNLKTAMRKVKRGDFSAQARVVDNNELGVLAQHFNQMTQGLKERYELLESLAIAKDVQQNLLPDTVPDIDGLDIAGKSLYCDQTGGDYYDFIDAQIAGQQTQIIALGDVSGHGIPSALLMASARAFLRQRLALSGSLDQIVNDVNVQFCRDVGYSGRFMTLFLLAYDLDCHTLKWIRAGHDPALLYHPETDAFIELKQGGGIPLGVDETYTYQENSIDGGSFEQGQILFIGTDGIWESCNPAGDMFGKERVKQIIRTHKAANAKFIMDQLIESLNTFMEHRSYSDDVTLIVIKKQ